MADSAATLSERPPAWVILAENVYRARTNRHPRWSQGTLAERSGVSLTTIKAIETCRNSAAPPYSTGSENIERLAAALGRSPEVLYSWPPRAGDWPTPSYRSGKSKRSSRMSSSNQPPLAVVQ